MNSSCPDCSCLRTSFKHNILHCTFLNSRDIQCAHTLCIPKIFLRSRIWWTIKWIPYVFLKYSIDLEYDEQMITNYQTFFHFSYSLKSVFPDSFMKIFSRFFSWRIFFVPFRKMVPFERLRARHISVYFSLFQYILSLCLSLIHIWRCRRYAVCRSRWSPYH